MNIELTPKQRSYLRSLGQKLKATIWIGKKDITEELIKAINTAFENKELIKVKMHETMGTEKKAAGEKIAKQSNAALVQVIGRVVLLYRPFKEKKVIKLP